MANRRSTACRAIGSEKSGSIRQIYAGQSRSVHYRLTLIPLLGCRNSLHGIASPLACLVLTFTVLLCHCILVSEFKKMNEDLRSDESIEQPKPAHQERIVTPLNPNIVPEPPVVTQPQN